MVGHCGICHSCQQDVLKQDFQDKIHCNNCKTEWINKDLGHKQTATIHSIGMPCYGCEQGLLMQQYGNIIYCNTCGTKWKAWKMRGYSKRQQFKHELSMI